jgi:hypothetical protein
MTKTNLYKTDYSSMEQNSSGLWDVYNDVTGLVMLTGIEYIDASIAMREIEQHYKALEHGNF